MRALRPSLSDGSAPGGGACGGAAAMFALGEPFPQGLRLINLTLKAARVRARSEGGSGGRSMGAKVGTQCGGGGAAAAPPLPLLQPPWSRAPEMALLSKGGRGRRTKRAKL